MSSYQTNELDDCTRVIGSPGPQTGGRRLMSCVENHRIRRSGNLIFLSPFDWKRGKDVPEAVREWTLPFWYFSSFSCVDCSGIRRGGETSFGGKFFKSWKFINLSLVTWQMSRQRNCSVNGNRITSFTYDLHTASLKSFKTFNQWKHPNLEAMHEAASLKLSVCLHCY